ncbi:MAG: polysaccharide deacetylase family protein [Bacillota bacterium]
MKNKLLQYGVILFILLLPVKVYGADDSLNNLIYIVVNEDLIRFENAYPVVLDGITYVPIRTIADVMGISLFWDDQKREVYLMKNDQTMILDIASKSLHTSEGNVIVDCLFVDNGRLMGPYKYIANYFGYEVSYLTEGPIVRAKNISAVLSDQDLMQTIKQEIPKEKERIKKEIERRKFEEAKAQGKLKLVYITFDDGPTMYTEQILNILNQYNSKATFFFLSNKMKENERAVKRVIDDGNSVGLHGVTHDIKKMYKSPSTLVSEMEECNSTLESIVGTRTNLIRVPYGSKPYMLPKFRTAVTKAGYKLWDWNVDSRDSLAKGITPEKIIENVKEQVKNQKTPVILLHERWCTVEALPEILKYLEENEYIILPIDYEQNPMNFWEGIHSK